MDTTLGTLLTWMAERKAKVFLVATANDIAALPPELLRKGRFDEIFFVDLPAHAIRQAIFELHLRKRGQDPSRFDLPALATAAEGFSGAEIEQAVVSALYSAHAKRMSLSTELVKEELRLNPPPLRADGRAGRISASMGGRAHRPGWLSEEGFSRRAVLPICGRRTGKVTVGFSEQGLPGFFRKSSTCA